MRNVINRRGGGWSLIELTIILIVLSILSAILVPVIGRYVHNARIIRAREDCGAISSVIWMFIEDTANSHFLQDGSPDPVQGASRQIGGGSAPDQTDPNRVNLMVGDGDIPELGPNGSARWLARVNFAGVDFMAYHLVTNRLGNSHENAYRTPTDLGKGPHFAPEDPMFSRESSGGFNSEFAWRGPYITAPIDPDPWGNRYACNVKFLDPQDDSRNRTAALGTDRGNGYEEDVVVLSAGPDDLISLVSSNSRP